VEEGGVEGGESVGDLLDHFGVEGIVEGLSGECDGKNFGIGGVGSNIEEFIGRGGEEGRRGVRERKGGGREGGRRGGIVEKGEEGSLEEGSRRRREHSYFL